MVGSLDASIGWLEFEGLSCHATFAMEIITARGAEL